MKTILLETKKKLHRFALRAALFAVAIPLWLASASTWRLTQFDLARRVGCSESQITKIETERATPEESLREAIALESWFHAWEVGQ